MQAKYENWLGRVINKKTGQFYQEKDKDTGLVVPDSRARYVVTVINRVRDSSKKEYLTTKGWLVGFNEAGRLDKIWISWPEIHTHTEFAYERFYNERTGAHIEYTVGPAPGGTQEVYSLDFTQDNLKSLYSQTENDDIEFNLKDLKTGEAKRIEWSSVKDTLDLFMHKSFDYLWKDEYIPLPARMEARQEAVAKGLIKGVTSDFEMSVGQGKGPGAAYT